MSEPHPLHPHLALIVHSCLGVPARAPGVPARSACTSPLLRPGPLPRPTEAGQLGRAVRVSVSGGLRNAVDTQYKNISCPEQQPQSAYLVLLDLRFAFVLPRSPGTGDGCGKGADRGQAQLGGHQAQQDDPRPRSPLGASEQDGGMRGGDASLEAARRRRRPRMPPDLPYFDMRRF